VIVFLDANAVIYLIEAAQPFANSVRDELTTLADEHPQLTLALSRLSWLECRVGPLKQKDQETLARYDNFFRLPDLVWVELSKEVVEKATLLRSRYGLRTPDALQAASCLQFDPPAVMLTGDSALQRIDELQVTLLV
jgi:predicted nucleic acid-binding protein